MWKRAMVVLSSTDDDDDDVGDDNDKDFSAKSKLRYSKNSVPKAASVPRTNPRRPKKARISNSCSRSVRNANPFHEMKLFCEDSGGGFAGFKVSAGYERNNKESWLEKYKPSSLVELAVHRKKVEEVKVWFEERMNIGKDVNCNHVLLITGQAGVGKSATVHAIASHIGATVCEWNTPTPTIWQEHVHTTNAGLRYMSKLDEFENFVERIRKYGLISSSLTGISQKPFIILIDDLPVINGNVSYGRLRHCLHLLVQSVRITTVILITDYGRTDSADYTSRCLEELHTFLQSVGACKVAFNPITTKSIAKTLSKICREEKLKITSDQIDVIAKASGGDIRHAITSLQYFSLKSDSKSTSDDTTYSRKRTLEINHLDDGFYLPFGRDETLSLFHALGKFLHNKRETEDSIASGNHHRQELASAGIGFGRKWSASITLLKVLYLQSSEENFFPTLFWAKSHFLVKYWFFPLIVRDSVLLREEFTRLPMKMDAPEKILCQAHGQARPIADFLQENVVDFLHEEAVDDAWVVASYLSDADTLLASLNGVLSRNYEAENIIQSTAASVAVRGVMFGNCHPLSSRWHAIRRPQLWQVEQSLWRNKKEMIGQRCVAYSVNLSDLSIIATEWKPMVKWLGLGPTSSDMVENDRKEISDDEIEDW